MTMNMHTAWDFFELASDIITAPLMLLFGERAPIVGTRTLSAIFFGSLIFQMVYLLAISVFLMVRHAAEFRKIWRNFYKNPTNKKKNIWKHCEAFRLFVKLEIMGFSLPILVGTGLFLATSWIPALNAMLLPWIALLFVGTFLFQSLRKAEEAYLEDNAPKRTGHIIQLAINVTNLVLLSLIFGSLCYPTILPMTSALMIGMTVLAVFVTVGNLISTFYQQSIQSNPTQSMPYATMSKPFDIVQDDLNPDGKPGAAPQPKPGTPQSPKGTDDHDNASADNDSCGFVRPPTTGAGGGVSTYGQ